ncbi:MAG TPA: hypothetical protein VG899_04440 [Mycobacteriales bacterium]|nr:hypothetical protein [Mycobacteriales bacterium]
MDSAGNAAAGATAVLAAQQPTRRPLPPAPWRQMPPVGSPEAPYPPRPGEAPRDHARELEAEIEIVHQALDEARRRLREVEAARDAEARNRAAADAEIVRQRNEAAELLGRVRWLERALGESQQQNRHQHDQLQELASRVEALVADGQRRQQAAAAEVQRAQQAAATRVALAEHEAREAAEAAARHKAQADARCAELSGEVTTHRRAAEELRQTVDTLRAELDAVVVPLHDTIAQLRDELTDVAAERDRARLECIELEAELNRLLTQPTPAELVEPEDVDSDYVQPELPEAADAEPAYEEAAYEEAAYAQADVQPDLAGNYPAALVPGRDLHGWQRDALDAWLSANHRGVVETVTGVDRQRLAQWAIARALDDGGKAMVLVSSADRAERRYDELREALPGHRVGMYIGRLRSAEFDVVVATADAAAKERVFEGTGHLLVLADDLHDVTAAELAAALDDSFERRLALSSEYDGTDSDASAYLAAYFGDVVFRLDHDRAVAEDALAGFDIALIEVSFTDDERAAYEEADRQVRELADRLVSNFGVPVDDFAAEVEARAAAWSGRARSTARSYLSAVASRAEVMSRCAAKDVVARTLIHFPGAAHALVFSSATVGRADLVGSKSGSDFAIALSASGSKREMAERLGRLTGSGPSGSRRRLAVIYVAGTVEDDRCDGNVTHLSDITPHACRIRRFDNTMLDELADFLS